MVRMTPDTARAVAARRRAQGRRDRHRAASPGIQAAKRTAELIPLCHPLPLSFVDVEVAIDAAAGS